MIVSEYFYYNLDVPVAIGKQIVLWVVKMLNDVPKGQDLPRVNREGILREGNLGQS